MSDDLATWLLEQIAEDETDVADARKALVHRVAFAIGKARGENEHRMAGAVFTSLCREAEAAVASDDHIDAFARVLAECDAKRSLVEFWSIAYRRSDDDPGPGFDRVRANALWTLKKLAKPYADRPGYREEWRL